MIRRAAPVVRARPDGGGKTIEQILGEASRAMDLDAAEQQWRHGRPVQIRRPRKTLRRWLTGRR